jgi:hypothetical protein
VLDRNTFGIPVAFNSARYVRSNQTNPASPTSSSGSTARQHARVSVLASWYRWILRITGWAVRDQLVRGHRAAFDPAWKSRLPHGKIARAGVKTRWVPPPAGGSAASRHPLPNNHLTFAVVDTLLTSRVCFVSRYSSGRQAATVKRICTWIKDKLVHGIVVRPHLNYLGVLQH